MEKVWCVCMFLQHVSVDTHTHTHSELTVLLRSLRDDKPATEPSGFPSLQQKNRHSHSTLMHYAIGGRKRGGGRRWEGEGWGEGGACLVSGHPEVLTAVSRHHMPAGRTACCPGVEECTCIRGRGRGGVWSFIESFPSCLAPTWSEASHT